MDEKSRRGGSWNNNPLDCRSAYHNDNKRGLTINYYGFRVVCHKKQTGFFSKLFFLFTKFRTNKMDTNKMDTQILSSFKIELVQIPSGEFLMGSPDDDPTAFSDEKPQHKVSISYDFLMGKTPITQAQWLAVMGLESPSYFKGENRPVESISWHDAQEFVKRLNKFLADTEYEASLPTEAEWEYACRAGTTTKYYFGDDPAQLGEFAWYYENSESQTHEVGQKKPNAWGLYDMHGNVWEWCEDDWHNSYDGAPTDGSAWIDA